LESKNDQCIQGLLVFQGQGSLEIPNQLAYIENRQQWCRKKAASPGRVGVQEYGPYSLRTRIALTFYLTTQSIGGIKDCSILGHNFEIERRGIMGLFDLQRPAGFLRR
jgi:hypothetical protein